MKKVLVLILTCFSVQSSAAFLTICQDGAFSQIIVRYGKKSVYKSGVRDVLVRLSGPVSMKIHGNSYMAEDLRGALLQDGVISFGIFHSRRADNFQGIWENGSKELTIRSYGGYEVWKFAHCQDFS